MTKKRKPFPYKIFVADPGWPIEPGSKLHKAHLRLHRGYSELTWRDRKRVRTHHLGKVLSPKKRSKK